MQSFGTDQAWTGGISNDELFKRTCFLSNLLQKEEVQRFRITEKNRPYFDELIKVMLDRKIMLFLNEKLVLKVGAETFILFVSSLIWPMIDSYYATLLFTVSMAIGKEGSSASVEASEIVKKIQWLSESLYEERVLRLFEACNIESIKNAVATFREMGIIESKSVFLLLADKYRHSEKELAMLLDEISRYRCQANLQELVSKSHES